MKKSLSCLLLLASAPLLTAADKPAADHDGKHMPPKAATEAPAAEDKHHTSKVRPNMGDLPAMNTDAEGVEPQPTLPTQEALDAENDATKHRDVEPDEIFKKISGVEKLWILEEGEVIDHKLQEARVAHRARDFQKAEMLYLEALNRDLSSNERYEALLQMAKLYLEADEIMANSNIDAEFLALFGRRTTLRENTGESIVHLIKAISVYEKFVALYPEDDLIPRVNFELGDLYRTVGANDLAIARFYNVLNSVIKLSEPNIPAYQALTLAAKEEIADTYFLAGDFEEAVEFFSRLKLLKQDSGERQETLFKIAYSQFMLEEYELARADFALFLKDYPNSILAPEAHYYLARAYSLLDKPEKAVEQVLALLKHKRVTKPESAKIWFYWQKKAGNELANEFYEDKDSLSALKIYQTMYTLDPNPRWRGPILYQMGLCYERLEALKNAKESFERVVNRDFWSKESEEEAYKRYANSPSLMNDQDLVNLGELAQWRLDHIDWNTDTKNRLQRLLTLGDGGS